ncbi:Sec-independent protein translocase protein TatB [Wenzhouxiangella limi]|uniref:Twin-arginine translocase subunit TatB n=1 Tax=Wenzhouxiangella limi TaxID=2707351 RepID=A0A845V3U0_9GAMM|nr:Sec-independent protein translocase protein TatB [Wenzhouxiangella limi]NDY95876.1 twin-arginine translocase subunit TatB [Wenzhouxiangella limi]
MSGIGFTELVLLAVLALLVVGPKRLPEIARTAGQMTRTVRGAWQNIKSEFQSELDNEHNRRIMEAAAKTRKELETPFRLDEEPKGDRKDGG